MGDRVEEDEMGEACSMHGKDENCIHILRPLERPSRKWEDNIRM